MTRNKREFRTNGQEALATPCFLSAKESPPHNKLIRRANTTCKSQHDAPEGDKDDTIPGRAKSLSGLLTALRDGSTSLLLNPVKDDNVPAA
jgi:hypothetical protein